MRRAQLDYSRLAPSPPDFHLSRRSHRHRHSLLLLPCVQTELFERDQAARAKAAADKAKQSSAKFADGMKKQKELVDERKAAERAEKKNKDEARREFHEAQRRKTGQTALIKERRKRKEDEKAAAAMLKAAEHAKVEAEHANERAELASKDLNVKKRLSGQSPESSTTGARTQYEHRMRAQFGTDESLNKFRFW